jgi:hypothetical protein
MRTRVLLLTGFLLAMGSPGHAGDFWKDKDYRQWSRNECRKMLQDSPWAKAYVLSQVFITSLDAPLADQRQAAEREREANPRTVFQLQLRSARPIRQALVRLQQLQMGYDERSEEERQQFDRQAEEFLAAQFPDTVIVYVEYGSNVDADNRRLRLEWQSKTTETLRNSVFLLGSKGVRVPLENYTVAEGAQQTFQFVFPRQVDGRPVVGPQDKRLQVEFEYGGQRLLVEFPLKKMMVGGDLLF